MRSPARQAGMSYFGWLIIIAMVGVLVVVGLRLFPVYLGYFSVQEILERVAAEQGIGIKSKRYVWDRLSRHFQINDIDHLSIEDLEIEIDQGGQATFHIDYEVRTKLVGNLDAVAVFHAQAKAN